MVYNLIKRNIFLFIACLFLGCSGQGNTSSDTTVIKSQANLSLVANGEDFVRKGFITKDGWKINFDQVEVTVGEVIAYQVEGNINLQEKSQIPSERSIQLLKKPQSINLAVLEKQPNTVLVKQSIVPKGFYNVLSWKMLPKIDRTFPDGSTILLKGVAIKADQKLNFLLGFNQPLKYVCGEFIGDTRKGIVEPGKSTELEMTFHFDHIFGDATARANDPLNQKALGFEPLANLTTSNSLKLSHQDLSKKLSPQNYLKLQTAIAGIGHVGEGHCTAIK